MNQIVRRTEFGDPPDAFGPSLLVHPFAGPLRFSECTEQRQIGVPHDPQALERAGQRLFPIAKGADPGVLIKPRDERAILGERQSIPPRIHDLGIRQVTHHFDHAPLAGSLGPPERRVVHAIHERLQRTGLLGHDLHRIATSQTIKERLYVRRGGRLGTPRGITELRHASRSGVR